jgi:hypothetical protein
LKFLHVSNGALGMKKKKQQKTKQKKQTTTNIHVQRIRDQN